MCVGSLKKILFFRKGAVRDLAVKAMGDGTGKAVAAELSTSWKDKLFQSYSVTNKIRKSSNCVCHRKTCDEPEDGHEHGASPTQHHRPGPGEAEAAQLNTFHGLTLGPSQLGLYVSKHNSRSFFRVIFKYLTI